EQDGQGGQEAARPPGPESTQVEPAAARSLGDQQVGDQVAAEHEEDVDTQVSAQCPRYALVEGHDGQDREGPHAVEAGCSLFGAGGTTASSRSLLRCQTRSSPPGSMQRVDLRRTG